MPALRAIYFAARKSHFTWLDAASLAETDFDRATADEPILVAIVDGQPAGFVSWWPPDNFVHNLFVSPAFTRRGLGRQLLTACLQHIGRPATLKCVQQNLAALAFYESLGWRIAGEGASADGTYFLLQLDA